MVYDAQITAIDGALLSIVADLDARIASGVGTDQHLAARISDLTGELSNLRFDLTTLAARVAALEPVTPPPATVHARLLTVAEFAARGVLSDAAALAAIATAPEIRPENTIPNGTYPTDAQLTAYRERDIWQGGLSITATAWWRRRQLLVTGRPGRALSTDEIIQWVAHKWGLDADMLRAQVCQESWWRQSTAGYYRADATKAPPGAATRVLFGATQYAMSYGAGQLKYPFHAGAAWPAARDCTAFNLDHLGCILRNTFDGLLSWMAAKPSPPAGWPLYTDVGGDPATRMWLTMGAHYSGGWGDAGALGYITQVKRWHSERPWTRADF